MERIAGFAAALASVVLLVVGAAAVQWYVWDVAVSQAGQPDRSMLFWGLPVLFIGVIGALASVGMALLARRALSSSR